MLGNYGLQGALGSVRRRLRAWLLSDKPPESFWRGVGVAPTALSGVTVTDQTALRVTAVLSCVKVLAEPISTLPLTAFDRQANGDKRAVAEQPLSPVLHVLANEEATAQSVRERPCALVLLRGSDCVGVVRGGAGVVRGFWPRAPGSLQLDRPRPSGALAVHVADAGAPPET